MNWTINNDLHGWVEVNRPNKMLAEHVFLATISIFTLFYWANRWIPPALLLVFKCPSVSCLCLLIEYIQTSSMTCCNFDVWDQRRTREPIERLGRCSCVHPHVRPCPVLRGKCLSSCVEQVPYSRFHLRGGREKKTKVPLPPANLILSGRLLISISLSEREKRRKARNQRRWSGLIEWNKPKYKHDLFSC